MEKSKQKTRRGQCIAAQIKNKLYQKGLITPYYFACNKIFGRKQPNNISVIITGRNDNYDGDFEDRLAIALSHNIKSLPFAEFIFVEWNSYPDRPMVCQNLRKLFHNRIRYIVVDPKFHDKYCTIDGFLEYPPKNVGIRRALGDYILCTNSDVVFSPEVTGVLNDGSLNEKMFYRATRMDIKPDYQKISFPLDPQYIIERNEGLTNACGDFLMMHKNLWNEITGYCEAFPNQRLHKDSFLVSILTNRMGIPFQYIGDITHWRHPSSWCNCHNTAKTGDPNWRYEQCNFTKNPPDWGLAYAQEEIRDGITWLI